MRAIGPNGVLRLGEQLNWSQACTVPFAAPAQKSQSTRDREHIIRRMLLPSSEPFKLARGVSQTAANKRASFIGLLPVGG